MELKLESPSGGFHHMFKRRNRLPGKYANNNNNNNYYYYYYYYYFKKK
jgi:hypothetical protein